MEAEHQRDDAGTGRHFSGVAARVLIDHVEHRRGAAGIKQLLSAAGETRSVEQLTSPSGWSTYDQFRRLLLAAGAALGGGAFLSDVRIDTMRPTETTAGADQALHKLGSPAAVYAQIPEANRLILTISSSEAWEVGPGEWLTVRRLNAGFEPFPELCAFLGGVYSLVPTLFGLAPGAIVEEECQCDGAPACRVRIRWESTEVMSARVAALERRNGWQELRLEALQRTVADLVSGAGLEEVLSRIVASAAQAVPAPSYLLAIEAPDERVYAEGLDDQQAADFAQRILTGACRDDASCLVVEIASRRRRYGSLAAINAAGTAFLGSERVVLEAYAGLAAAALESATALEESRLQAATARALLELAVALSELSTADEMARRIAGAVPLVIDCDLAAVVLLDSATGAARFAGTYGLDAAAAARLAAEPFSVGEGEPGREPLVWQDRDHPGRLVEEAGAVASASVPIAANGQLMGWIAVGVVDRPERLHRFAGLAERLRGLAGQAATALGNAGLLDQVRHQALHDALTGLPNRTLILDRAEQMLASARRSGHVVAAMFIDLDNFKTINDTLGHAAGDELLQAVGARIASTLRGADTVGRLGGDEFVVLSESIGGAGPEVLADRICRVLRDPFQLDALGKAPLSTSASVGIASGDRAEAGDLLRDADIALYRAKGAGKGSFALFQAGMESQALGRLTLEMDLREALAAGQFFLAYQPVVDLPSGALTGFEASLRWEHPLRGVLLAEEFAEALEETGLIVDVGRWTLREACRTAATWQHEDRPLSVCVELFGRQLGTDSLVEDIRRCLRESGLSARLLTLKFSETALLRDQETTLERMLALKRLGVQLAIDRVGAGHSSWVRVRRCPLDQVKIDWTFVAATRGSSKGEALVRALVDIGHAAGLVVVADGIDRSDQLSLLENCGCDRGQGTVFSVPVTEGAVRSLLAEWPAPGRAQRAKRRVRPHERLAASG